METEKDNLSSILGAYEWGTDVRTVSRHGSGHINDTYKVVLNNGDGQGDYILQRLNQSVFTRPEEVMSNICGVSEYLKKEIMRNGGDVSREVMTICRTKDGKPGMYDENGEYWRVYTFIKDTICLDQAEKEADFYESGRCFGRFLRLLGGYPAETLYETIPHFHDTPKRFRDFVRAVEMDTEKRAQSVKDEIEFVLEREKDCAHLTDLLEQNRLPLRVTHNDTKLNNILLDSKTGKGVCIVDLDTIMPGLAAYDFGDSIRFGASTAAEDEPDLSKVHFSLSLYNAYLKGYLEEAGGIMTEEEIKSLAWGARLMTLECGMRFLADYLEGDHYFNIERPQHNLDRARTQFALVKEMEEALEY